MADERIRELERRLVAGDREVVPELKEALEGVPGFPAALAELERRYYRELVESAVSSDEADAVSADWVNLVNEFGASAVPEIDAALARFGTEWRAGRDSRLRAGRRLVYDLLLPFHDDASFLGRGRKDGAFRVGDVVRYVRGYDHVVLSSSGGNVQVGHPDGSSDRFVHRDGLILVEMSRTVLTWASRAEAGWLNVLHAAGNLSTGAYRHGLRVDDAGAYAARKGDRVVLGFCRTGGLTQQYPTASRVALEAGEGRRAWGLVSGRDVDGTWSEIARVELTEHQVLHFLLEHELTERRPDLLTPTSAGPETADELQREVERVVRYANGSREERLISAEAVKSATRLAISERARPWLPRRDGPQVGPPEGIDLPVVALSVTSNVTAALKAVAPRDETERLAWLRTNYDEDLAATGSTVPFYGRVFANAHVQRRARGGTRISAAAVAAERYAVTIFVMAVTGSIGNYGAAGALSYMIGEVSTTPETLRIAARRPSTSSVRVPLELAREWAFGLSAARNPGADETLREIRRRAEAGDHEAVEELQRAKYELATPARRAWLDAVAEHREAFHALTRDGEFARRSAEIAAEGVEALRSQHVSIKRSRRKGWEDLFRLAIDVIGPDRANAVWRPFGERLKAVESDILERVRSTRERRVALARHVEPTPGPASGPFREWRFASRNTYASSGTGALVAAAESAKDSESLARQFGIPTRVTFKGDGHNSGYLVEVSVEDADDVKLLEDLREAKRRDFIAEVRARSRGEGDATT